jgi:hypothetical protein
VEGLGSRGTRHSLVSSMVRLVQRHQVLAVRLMRSELRLPGGGIAATVVVLSVKELLISVEVAF